MLRFYNSRTRSIDPFLHEKEIPVHIYTCGPTVYQRAHIGNMRTFLWADFIIGCLRALGYKVKAVMNITDIDDKIIHRLGEQTMSSLREFTQHYYQWFLKDMKSLGIREFNSQNTYHVTDHLEDIKKMLSDLVGSGYGYAANDGSIYFDASKVEEPPFPGTRFAETGGTSYSHGRHIVRADGTRSTRDFVLWKKRPCSEIQFSSPFGFGRMGWHLECSAICRAVLGRCDIHMGGEDLKFPHHTCEILQSEALCPEEKYGRYWLHMGFLNVNGDKMSKSQGNFIKLDDVGVNGFLLRLYLLSKPYRQSFDFSLNELSAEKTGFLRFHQFYNRLRLGTYSCLMTTDQSSLIDETQSLYDQVMEKLAHDFDAKAGFQVVLRFLDRHQGVGFSKEEAATILLVLDRINRIYNILDENLLNIDPDVLKKINCREQKRKKRNFKEADILREEIKNAGYFVEDDPCGVSVIRMME